MKIPICIEKFNYGLRSSHTRGCCPEEMDIGYILMESYVIYAVRHINGTLEGKDLMETTLVFTFFPPKLLANG